MMRRVLTLRSLRRSLVSSPAAARATAAPLAAPMAITLSAAAPASIRSFKRNLTPDDVKAALETYQPSGRKDDYLMFASGGHAGQVFVIGLPSMRLLRSIAVFTPEPWQGWGYGVNDDILKAGDVNGKPNRWGDTHHPALSETNGDYDGQYLFINDKANARIAVIDLRDFETKQIIKNPVALNDHGGTMVTPNTDYVIEGGQYASPLGWKYAPLEEYNDEYRGMVTLLEVRPREGAHRSEQELSLWNCRRTGRIYSIPASSSVTAGSSATRSTPSWRPAASTRATLRSRPGLPARHADYLHIINLKKAEQLYKDGQDQAGQRLCRDSAADVGGRDVLVFRTRTQEPARRGGRTQRRFHRRLRQARSTRDHLQHRPIKKAIADKNWTHRFLRRARAGPGCRHRSAGRGRTWARYTPSSTTRATPIPRCFWIRRSRAGRWAGTTASFIPSSHGPS